jgi:hypothetical protein
MPDKRWWERIYRVDALYGLYGLGAAVISGVATIVAVVNSTSQSLTSWVWLVTFFGGAVAIAIAFAIGGRAWKTLVGGGDPTKHAPTAQNVAPASDDATPTRETEPDGSPVLFELRGAWLNTAFSCQPLGTNERGDPKYGEDLNLKILAYKLLENVRIIITVKDTAETKTRIEYHHHGMISGTVTPGMHETFRVFRRTFCLPEVQVTTKEGDQFIIRHREDAHISFFEGLSEKAAATGDIYNVDIILHHRQGQERCSFNLDLRPVEAPRSRLIIKRGKLYAGAPNNYAAPELPPTLCS